MVRRVAHEATGHRSGGRRLRGSAATALLAAALLGVGPAPAAPPSPTLRPTLVSGDPAGDEGVSCYVNPQTFANGYTETPRATVAACRVEVTDTLRIEFSNGSIPALLLIKGPQGFSRIVRQPELYIDLGMPVGAYRFEGAAGGREIGGGFTVALSSKRVVQVRFGNANGAAAIDHLALAGYAPSSRLTLFRYDQVKFEPTVGTGTRTWRRGAEIRELTADRRGEARVELQRSLFQPNQNYLVVSDPMQESSLNAARVMGEP